ncbi:hypothetical protein [Nitrosospira briensis]|nr:hypothetical protein [Nitrosospira briensis]
MVITFAPLSIHPALTMEGLDSDAVRIDMRSCNEQLPSHWRKEGRET